LRQSKEPTGTFAALHACCHQCTNCGMLYECGNDIKRCHIPFLYRKCSLCLR